MTILKHTLFNVTLLFFFNTFASDNQLAVVGQVMAGDAATTTSQSVVHVLVNSTTQSVDAVTYQAIMDNAQAAFLLQQQMNEKNNDKIPTGTVVDLAPAPARTDPDNNQISVLNNQQRSEIEALIANALRTLQQQTQEERDAALQRAIAERNIAIENLQATLARQEANHIAEQNRLQAAAAAREAELQRTAATEQTRLQAIVAAREAELARRTAAPAAGGGAVASTPTQTVTQQTAPVVTTPTQITPQQRGAELARSYINLYEHQIGNQIGLAMNDSNYSQAEKAIALKHLLTNESNNSDMSRVVKIYLTDFAQRGKLELIDIFFETSAQIPGCKEGVDAAFDSLFMNENEYSCYLSQTEAYKKLLSCYKKPQNNKNYNFSKPFIYACRNTSRTSDGYANLITAFLDAGVNVDVENGQALKYAAFNGNVQAAQILLDRGAQISVQEAKQIATIHRQQQILDLFRARGL